MYIVTNGQIPYWLNLDSPRISVITHEVSAVMKYFMFIAFLLFFLFFHDNRACPLCAFYVCNGNKICFCTYYYCIVIIDHPLVLLKTDLLIFCILLHFYIYFVSKLKSVFIQSDW